MNNESSSLAYVKFKFMFETISALLIS